MSTLAISAANLDILERSLQDLATNLGGVNRHVGEVTNHIYDVENNMKNVTDKVITLEEEIKAFMLEIRESSIVSNARQTILMDQAELDKKYGYYDEVRRKISGILQSTDIKAVLKSTVLNISENTMINAPYFWLAPALVSLCAWYLDDKELANKALNEAIKRDDEKTSLLFSLIHLRAGRVDTSVKWLDRYLTMQDPSKMEAKIITVIDAITNGNFGNDAVNLFLNKVNDWVIELESTPNVKNEQIERWKKFFIGFKKEIPDSAFPYLLRFGSNVCEIKDICSTAIAKKKIYDEIDSVILSNSNTSDSNIDSLVNDLVFNYENDELELKKDIEKNKTIIEENGNMNAAIDRFNDSQYALDKYNNFYSYLTMCALDNKHISNSVNSRKFSISYSKDLIKKAYTDFIKYDNLNTLPDISIKIEDWEGITKFGDNEQDLINSLVLFLKNKYQKEVNEYKYFNFKMLISIILGIGVMVLTFKWIYIALFVLFIVLLYNGYEIYKTYNQRKIKVDAVNEIIDKDIDILKNCIAEVVDYYFLYKKSLSYDEKFNNLVNGLNYNNYVIKK